MKYITSVWTTLALVFLMVCMRIADPTLLEQTRLNVFDSFDLAVADLKAGDADFLLGDLAVLDFYAVENAADGFSVVGNFEEENFGIGVRENTGEPESNSMLPIPTLAVFFAMLALPIMRKLRQ